MVKETGSAHEMAMSVQERKGVESIWYFVSPLELIGFMHSPDACGQEPRRATRQQ